MGAAGVLARSFRAYAAQLERHPWRTQIVSTGLLWGMGDALAQSLEGGPFAPRRNVLTALYGAAFIGPVGHAWYSALDRGARRLLKPGTAAFVGGKVVADTALFGPLHVAGYFAHMTLCDGGGAADVKAKLQRDFWPTFAAELAVWPAVQAANFRFVPVQFQLLVVNLFTILDSAFMSWARANDGWLDRLLAAGKGGDGGGGKG